jgi:hypothetical protein
VPSALISQNDTEAAPPNTSQQQWIFWAQFHNPGGWLAIGTNELQLTEIAGKMISASENSSRLPALTMAAAQVGATGYRRSERPTLVNNRLQWLFLNRSRP